MYKDAKEYYNLPKGWVLHHKDVTLKEKDPQRYNEWRIEDVVPMSKSEHCALHNRLNGAFSEERKEKIRKSVMAHHEKFYNIKHCKVCGKKVRACNKTGYCYECYRKSEEWIEHCRACGKKNGKKKAEKQ